MACLVYRHSPAPTSVAVLADRVFWTDLHYRDVLYHRKSKEHTRGRIAVNLSPLTSIVVVDKKTQPRGLWTDLLVMGGIIRKSVCR